MLGWPVFPGVYHMRLVVLLPEGYAWYRPRLALRHWYFAVLPVVGFSTSRLWRPAFVRTKLVVSADSTLISVALPMPKREMFVGYTGPVDDIRFGARP